MWKRGCGVRGTHANRRTPSSALYVVISGTNGLDENIDTESRLWICKNIILAATWQQRWRPRSSSSRSRSLTDSCHCKRPVGLAPVSYFTRRRPVTDLSSESRRMSRLLRPPCLQPSHESLSSSTIFFANSDHDPLEALVSVRLLGCKSYTYYMGSVRSSRSSAFTVPEPTVC